MNKSCSELEFHFAIMTYSWTVHDHFISDWIRINSDTPVRKPKFNLSSKGEHLVTALILLSNVYLPVSGQDKGTYDDDEITFSAIKCFFVGCVDPGGVENDLSDGRPLDYRVWSDTKTWNYVSGVWEAQKESTGTAATIPPNDQSLEVFIPEVC